MQPGSGLIPLGFFTQGSSGCVGTALGYTMKRLRRISGTDPRSSIRAGAAVFQRREGRSLHGSRVNAELCNLKNLRAVLANSGQDTHAPLQTGALQQLYPGRR